MLLKNRITTCAGIAPGKQLHDRVPCQESSSVQRKEGQRLTANSFAFPIKNNTHHTERRVKSVRSVDSTESVRRGGVNCGCGCWRLLPGLLDLGRQAVHVLHEVDNGPDVAVGHAVFPCRHPGEATAMPNDTGKPVERDGWVSRRSCVGAAPLPPIQGREEGLIAPI